MAQTAAAPSPATRPAYGPLPWAETIRRPYFWPALALAAALGLFWIAVVLRVEARTGIFLWADQYNFFKPLGENLADPYSFTLFPYVPWTAVIFYPLALLPVRVAVPVQMVLYFVLLTLLIFRYGGRWWMVLLVLTSSLAYDTALEINLEWVTVIGLLVPPVLSGPFLLVKPHQALGAWLAYRWRDILWSSVLVFVIMAVSLVIWPNWVADMLTAWFNNTLGSWGARVNIAVSQLIPRPISWGIGLALAYFAFRRKDVVIGVVAWQFFVPYTTFYGLMPVFALVATRWPWAALVISLAAWVPYSQVLLPFL